MPKANQGTVLLVENNGSLAFHMESALSSKGYYMIVAHGVREANAIWDEFRDQIDCIIVDLNMSIEAFSEEQVQRTEVLSGGKPFPGILSGWVWLTDYVFAEPQELSDRIPLGQSRDYWAKRTIIYSDYVADLLNNKTEEERKGISIIPKRSESSAAKQVLEAVNRICSLNRRSK